MLCAAGGGAMTELSYLQRQTWPNHNQGKALAKIDSTTVVQVWLKSQVILNLTLSQAIRQIKTGLRVLEVRELNKGKLRPNSSIDNHDHNHHDHDHVIIIK